MRPRRVPKGIKGEQEGDKRSKEGFNSAQEDSKGKQKAEGQEGGKRGPDR